MQVSPQLRLQPDASRYTLPRFLHDVAERHGPRVALRFEGASTSYAALRADARAVAKGLVARGIGKGTRVALLVANRPAWVTAVFGEALTGAVVVPVNTFATAEMSLDPVTTASWPSSEPARSGSPASFAAALKIEFFTTWICAAVGASRLRDSVNCATDKKTDDRIRAAAKFLARFEPGKIAAAASRLYAQEPVKKFCETTKATPIVGRFIPGLLSNPLYPNRIEPEVLIVSDPRADAQAVKEAASVGIPVVALCSTDNEFVGVDLVIPTNNKGRRALAVIYWLLARQVLREKGELDQDKDLSSTIDDFEAKITKEEEEM